MAGRSPYQTRPLVHSQALSSSLPPLATPLPYRFQQVLTEGSDTIINLLHYHGVRVRWASLKGENPELEEHLFEVEEEIYHWKDGLAWKTSLTLHWKDGHTWRVDPYGSPVPSTTARRQRLGLEALMQDNLEDETWRATFAAAEWSP